MPLVNAETNKSVDDFLNGVENEKRQADAKQVLEMMKKITGEAPKMWGKSIVGFGKYSYKRKNGQEFEWFNVGLSPTKAHLSVYVMYDINTVPELLEKLGKHKTGKGCLNIKSLADIDLDVLAKIIEKSDRWQQDQ